MSNWSKSRHVSYALRRLIEDPTWRQQHLITMTTVMLNVTYDVTVLLQHRVAMQEAWTKKFAVFFPRHSNGKAQVITPTQATVAPLVHLKENELQLQERHVRYVRKPFKLDMQPLLTSALTHPAIKFVI